MRSAWPRGAVDIGGGPAGRIGLDRDALGAQREQHRGHPVGVAEDLDEGVAVEQQVRGDRLDQRLAHPGEQAASPRLCAGVASIVTPPAPFRDDPHRALRDRIAEIGGADLRLVAARPVALRRRAYQPKVRVSTGRAQARAAFHPKSRMGVSRSGIVET